MLSSFQYLTKRNSDSQGFYFLVQIVIGAFPILVVGFIAKEFLDTIKARPDLLDILAIAWIFGGVLILIAEWFFQKRQGTEKKNGRFSGCDSHRNFSVCGFDSRSF